MNLCSGDNCDKKSIFVVYLLFVCLFVSRKRARQPEETPCSADREGGRGGLGVGSEKGVERDTETEGGLVKKKKYSLNRTSSIVKSISVEGVCVCMYM